MKNTNPTNESNTNVDIPNIDRTSIPKKPVKPPKLEDKPFNEFISNQFKEIGIATPPTILLTFIFMQSGFHSEIPQISYVTFLDRVYFLCYLLSVISMVNAVLAGTKRNKMRRYFYKIFHTPLSIVLRKIYFLIAIFGPFAAYFIP